MEAKNWISYNFLIPQSSSLLLTFFNLLKLWKSLSVHRHTWIWPVSCILPTPVLVEQHGTSSTISNWQVSK
jgi:hypothetical protein